MRNSSRFIAIVLTAVMAVSSLPFDVAGTSGDGLRLYEVIPWGKAEGVSLYNYGHRDADLKDHYLDDGEGTVKFTASIIVRPGESITILATVPGTIIAEGRNVLTYGESGITAKGFQLNDKGDEVMLRTVSGTVVDAFVYGTGGPAEGWSGEAFPDISNNKVARRTSAFDTDTAADWTLIVPGQSSFSGDGFIGTASPFVFPDSEGIPVLDAISLAEEEILISMYEMDNADIVSLLIAALGRGVTVRILMEGSPVGGISQTELGLLSALHRAGADVMLMKNIDGFRRYSYIHNKYAVIDSGTVVLTSENWKSSSFQNNRGWGAIIVSEGYAEYMRAVFLEDSDTTYGDVTSFISLHPAVLPYDVRSYIHTASVLEWHDVVVSPVIGPDFALDTLNGMIDSAASRVYSEQMTVDISWTEGVTPLTKMDGAAKRGVDARLIIDVKYDSPYDSNMNDGYWVKELMKDRNVRIKTSDDCGLQWYVHNKGAVIDDSVWIGSMNWNSSFRNNREVGAVLFSKDVADLFASFFLSDWGAYDGMVTLVVDVTAVSGGAVLDASGSVVPYGALFEWDIGSDGTVDRTGVKIIVDLPAGTHGCTLYVRDDDGIVHSYSFIVTVNDGGGYHPYLRYLPVVMLCIMILAYSAMRRRDADHTRLPPR